MSIKTPWRLSVSHVNKHFGGLQALCDVGLRIMPGQIHGLIGPNGAGKTTFFNVITGLVPPDGGEFEIDGKPYTPVQIDTVARAGIARTFQNIRLFGRLSVLENVMVARHARTRQGLLGAIFRTRAQRREEYETAENALAWLDYVGIAHYADEPASTLSYGHQRRLEIARALATDASLLALDEPAAGMNKTEKAGLQTLLNKIRQDAGHNSAILLIEHDVRLMMDLCDWVTVLDYGKVIAQGPPQHIQQDPQVISAYLGVVEQDEETQ